MPASRQGRRAAAPFRTDRGRSQAVADHHLSQHRGIR